MADTPPLDDEEDFVLYGTSISEALSSRGASEASPPKGTLAPPAERAVRDRIEVEAGTGAIPEEEGFILAGDDIRAALMTGEREPAGAIPETPTAEEGATGIAGFVGRRIHDALKPVEYANELGKRVVDRAVGTSADIVGGTAALPNLNPLVDEDAKDKLLREFQTVIEANGDNVKPNISYEEAKKALLEERDLPTFVQWAFEEVVASAPDMALTIFAPPLMGLAHTERMAQERAAAQGRKETNSEDYLINILPAIAITALDRFPLLKALGIGDEAGRKLIKESIVKHIGKSMVRESATEGAQEFIESLATKLGTKEGWDFREAFEQTAVGAGAGLVGGAVFGGVGAGVAAKVDDDKAAAVDAGSSTPEQPETVIPETPARPPVPAQGGDVAAPAAPGGPRPSIPPEAARRPVPTPGAGEQLPLPLEPPAQGQLPFTPGGPPARPAVPGPFEGGGTPMGPAERPQGRLPLEGGESQRELPLEGAVPRTAPRSAVSTVEPDETVDEFTGRTTVSNLRKMAKGLGIPSSGNKAKLGRRVFDEWRRQEEQPVELPTETQSAAPEPGPSPVGEAPAEATPRVTELKEPTAPQLKMAEAHLFDGVDTPRAPLERHAKDLGIADVRRKSRWQLAKEIVARKRGAEWVEEAIVEGVPQPGETNVLPEAPKRGKLAKTPEAPTAPESITPREVTNKEIRNTFTKEDVYDRFGASQAVINLARGAVEAGQPVSIRAGKQDIPVTGVKGFDLITPKGKRHVSKFLLPKPQSLVIGEAPAAAPVEQSVAAPEEAPAAIGEEPAPEPAPARRRRTTTDVATLAAQPRAGLVQQAEELGIAQTKRKSRAVLAKEIIAQRRPRGQAQARAAAQAAEVADQDADLVAAPAEASAADTIAPPRDAPAIIASQKRGRKTKTAAAQLPRATAAPAISDQAYAKTRRTPTPTYRMAAARANVDLHRIGQIALDPGKSSAKEVRNAVRLNNVVRRELGVAPQTPSMRKSRNVNLLRQAMLEAQEPVSPPSVEATRIIEEEYLAPIAEAQTPAQRGEVAEKAKRKLPPHVAKKIERVAKRSEFTPSRDLLEIVITKKPRKGSTKPQIETQPYSLAGLERAQKKYGSKNVRVEPRGTGAVRTGRRLMAEREYKREVKNYDDLLGPVNIIYGRSSDTVYESMRGTRIIQAMFNRNVTVIGNQKVYTDMDEHGVRSSADLPGGAIGLLTKIAPKRYEPVVKALQKIMETTGIEPVVRFERNYDNFPEWKGARGLYSADTDVIILFPTADFNTLLHEMVHYATAHVLEARPDLWNRMESLRKVAEKAADRNLPMHPYRYGLKDVGEFVAEAFANPDFQQVLRDTKMPYSEQWGNVVRDIRQKDLPTAWTRFIDIVRQVLGARVTRSVMDEVLSQRNDLFDAQAKLEALDMLPKGQREMLAERVPSEVTTAAFEAAEMQARWKIHATRWQRTARRSAEKMRDRFVPDGGGESLLSLFVEAFAKKTAAINVHSREGSALNNKWAKFESDFPEHRKALNELYGYATVFNVNPTIPPEKHMNQHVNREAHKKAKEMYDALPPEGQQLIKDTNDFYQSEWNKIVDLLLRNLIRIYGYNMTTDDLTQALDNIHAARGGVNKQALRDQYLASVGGKAGEGRFFQFAEDITKRGRMDFYVPLRRYGEYVVEVAAEIEKPVTMSEDKLDKLLADEGSILYAKNKQSVRDANGKPTGDVTANIGMRIVDFSEGRRTARRRQQMAQDTLQDLTKQYAHLGKWKITHQGGLTTAIHHSFQSGDAAGRILEQVRSKVIQPTDAGGRMQEDTITEGQFQLLRQAMIELMPATSIHKAQLHRKGVAGWSVDHRRSLAHHVRTSSYYMAELEHGQEVRARLRDLEVLSKNRAAQGQDQDVETALIAHLYERLDATMGLQTNNRLLQTLTDLGFLAYLGSGSYSVVNLTQSTFSWSKLGGRYGTREATEAYVNAFNMVSGRVLKSMISGYRHDIATLNPGRRSEAFSSVAFEAFDHIKREMPNDTELHDIIQSLIDQGLIDWTQVMDLKNVARQGTADWVNDMADQDGVTAAIGKAFDTGGQVWGVMMDITRFAPHSVEIHNRLAAAIATYQTAKADGLTGHELKQEVIDVINQTHIDYSSWNEPKIISEWGPFGKAARPIMMFKKFAIGVYYLYGDMFVTMVDKNATRKQRLEAFRFASLFFMSQAALAGVANTVLIEPLMMALTAVGMALGVLGLDDPDDPTEFWDDPVGFVNDTVKRLDLPDFMENAMIQGVPSSLGMDMSSRLAQTNMLFYGAHGSDLEEKWLRWLAQTGGGPMVDFFLAFPEALEAYQQGQTIDQVVSRIRVKGIRDLMRAYQMSDRGLLRPNGDVAIPADRFDYMDLVVTGFGFQAPEVARHYREQARDFDLQNAMARRRSNLQRRYVNAFDRGDREEVLRVLEQVRAFNMSGGIPPIKDLHELVKGRRKREAVSARGHHGRSPREAARFEAWKRRKGIPE